MTPEQALKNWLHGTTCFHQKRSIEWVSDDQRFVLLKHHGHSEYMGRWTGSRRCPTSYQLVDLADRDFIPLVLFKSDPDQGIWCWTGGRWSKARQAEAEAIIKERLGSDA